MSVVWIFYSFFGSKVTSKHIIYKQCFAIVAANPHCCSVYGKSRFTVLPFKASVLRWLNFLFNLFIFWKHSSKKIQ